MKLLYLLSAVAFSCVFGTFQVSKPVHAQVSNEEYAYLVWSQDVAYVQVVDPISGADIKQINLSVPHGWRFYPLNSLSPDGSWLLYAVEQRDNISYIQELRLLNVAAEEIRSVTLPTDGIVSTDEQVQWSPDSQHIAITVVISPFSMPVVYSISNNTLHVISGASNSARRLSWANSANKIAASVANPPQDTIEVYDLGTHTLIESYLLPDTPFPLSVACNLTWSRDDIRIAFGASCFADDPVMPTGDAIKETYVINRSQSTIERISDYTVSAKQQGIYNYFSVQYSPYWANNTDLLIGVLHHGFDNGEIIVRDVETVLFQSDLGSMEVLRTGRITDWEDNLLYPEVAFRIAPEATFPTVIVEIATFNEATGSLDSVATTTAGCDLAWSQDGEMLVIVQMMDNVSCSGDIESIRFIGRNGSLLQSYNVSAVIGQSNVVRPLGWVQTQAQSTLSVDSLTLVNADTDTDLFVLSDGTTITLNQPPINDAEINVRANASGTVGSVVFDLDGTTGYRTEDVAPYTVAGVSGSDYLPWNISLGGASRTSGRAIPFGKISYRIVRFVVFETKVRVLTS